MFMKVIIYVLVNNAISLIQARDSAQLKFTKAYPNDKSTRTLISQLQEQEYFYNFLKEDSSRNSIDKLRCSRQDSLKKLEEEAERTPFFDKNMAFNNLLEFLKHK